MTLSICILEIQKQDKQTNKQAKENLLKSKFKEMTKKEIDERMIKADNDKCLILV